MSIKPEFKKFNSLENSYRENFMNKIREHGYENEEYIITEKLHGANYSFTVVVECGIVVSVIPAKLLNFLNSGLIDIFISPIHNITLVRHLLHTKNIQ